MDRPGTAEQVRDRRRFNPLTALMKRKLMAMGQRRQGGLGQGSMPSTATRAKTGHRVQHWRLLGRQALVTRALHLGVLVKAKDAPPSAVGKVGKGQFRTWKSLAAAVQRAEQALVDVPR